MSVDMSLAYVYCPACDTVNEPKNIIGVEYSYDSPNRYDGVSEWIFTCGHRVGRWTGDVLEDGQEEPRFGGVR